MVSDHYLTYRVRCTCAPGFGGDRCEQELNPCDSGPCVNGRCEKTGINAFRCVCIQGYTGILCDTIIDQCASSPCQNGANCVSLGLAGKYSYFGVIQIHNFDSRALLN